MSEKEMKFADKLARLEEIVTKIESGDLSLEESISLFEEGKKLIKELNMTLEEAKKKIGKFETIEK